MFREGSAVKSAVIALLYKIVFFSCMYCLKILWQFYFVNIVVVIFRDVLSEEGSAVDAAVAILFCNSVVTSQSMGIGKIQFSWNLNISIFAGSPHPQPRASRST